MLSHGCQRNEKDQMKEPEGILLNLEKSIVVSLEGIVDYAGLFPPAKLELKDALNEYVGYIKDKDYAWLLSRFVIPVDLLQKVSITNIDKDKIFSSESPMRFSVLTGYKGALEQLREEKESSDNPESDKEGRRELAIRNETMRIKEQLFTDLEKVNQFHISKENRGSVICDSFELRVPLIFLEAMDVREIKSLLKSVEETFQEGLKAEKMNRFKGRKKILCFLEVPYSEGKNWNECFDMLVRGVKLHNAEGQMEMLESAQPTNDNEKNTEIEVDLEIHFMLKIRTGGLKPELIPSTNRLAHALKVVNRAQLQLKATAGLHHPIRAYNSQLNTELHGFLNIIIGCALLKSNTISEEELDNLLDEKDVNALFFSDTGVSWEKHTCTIETLEEVRKSFFVSFGSCTITKMIPEIQISRV